jgi:hypothetical protein
MEPLEALARSVGTISDVVRMGDEAAFVELMDRGKRYLASRN